MVHQHFMLVRTMTVLENIMLGLKSSRGPFLDRRVSAKRLQTLMDDFHIHVDMDQEIRNLSVGTQQRVEILKALYRNSRLLILDEPTAVLTPDEVTGLFAFIRRYTAQGNSVVMITHKLEEILDVSDRITVMRSGRVVRTCNRCDVADKHELAASMVGADMVLSLDNSRATTDSSDVVLEANGITVHDNRGLKAVDAVDVCVRKGEILGIAGVSGNGQTELAEALSGMRILQAGSITIRGVSAGVPSTRSLQQMGLRYIPEDRHQTGLVLKFSIKDNLLLTRHQDTPHSRRGRLDHAYNRTFARDVMARFHVVAPDADTPVEQLSGGNQQKVILGRELADPPVVLVAAQPTRGLDVAATRFVQQTILDQKRQGTAVVYISTALDEVLEMSDRIAVMYKGRIVGMCDSRDADMAVIGALMAGSNPSAPTRSNDVGNASSPQKGAL
jgi:simple sugar transport system ATP-binding protein